MFANKKQFSESDDKLMSKNTVTHQECRTLPCQISENLTISYQNKELTQGHKKYTFIHVCSIQTTLPCTSCRIDVI